MFLLKICQRCLLKLIKSTLHLKNLSVVYSVDHFLLLGIVHFETRTPYVKATIEWCWSFLEMPTVKQEAITKAVISEQYLE